MAMHIFISTGEVSGDLQGSLLIEALKRQAVELGMDLEISAIGGDRMKKAGAKLLGNTSAIGSVGILESLPFILPILWLQRRVQAYLRQRPPDLVVLIDYFGSNVGMGRYIRQQFPNVPIVYYIAPQEWVWSLSSRNTQRIVKICDRLLAIFPEEARYYERFGANVTFIGHPLVDRVAQYPSREQARQSLGIAADQVAIALFPASRPQELRYLLPVIVEAAQRLQQAVPNAGFWIPIALPEYKEAIATAIERYNLRATVVSENKESVIAAADLAIAKSGTVNLEIALMKVPQVVLYRVNPITAWIAKHLLNFSIPFMSPPNLVDMKAIVPELLQDEATPNAVLHHALELLNPDNRQQMQQDYIQMQKSLGDPNVCDRAARVILGMKSVGR